MLALEINIGMMVVCALMVIGESFVYIQSCTEFTQSFCYGVSFKYRVHKIYMLAVFLSSHGLVCLYTNIQHTFSFVGQYG